jgi:LmbE family N-acetylglucosaminyl deacetylase
LVLAPHQDDETIGAGGTLLLAKRAGVELHVLFVTDGRSKGAVSYGETPEEVIRIRNREAAKVGSHLGAQIHHLGITRTLAARHAKTPVGQSPSMASSAASCAPELRGMGLSGSQ